MRPSWPDYFLGIAKVVSQRSHDIHTQHGCVITDKQNRILGVGYNGFPKGMDHSTLPTSRPEKYHWMIHAERNALSNCTIRPDNGTAYVTGQCCNDCMLALWQDAQKRFDLFVSQTQIEIVRCTPNFSWIQNLDF